MVMALLKLTLVSQSVRGHPYGGLREKEKKKKKSEGSYITLLFVSKLVSAARRGRFMDRHSARGADRLLNMQGALTVRCQYQP